jgi:protein-S-isoprenylcysteine O-methyltransferase Ste14
MARASFALGSVWALLFAVLIFVVIVLRLLDEEKFLLKNLQGYEEYCVKVRFRLIPLIW